MGEKKKLAAESKKIAELESTPKLQMIWPRSKISRSMWPSSPRAFGRKLVMEFWLCLAKVGFGEVFEPCTYVKLMSISDVGYLGRDSGDVRTLLSQMSGSHNLCLFRSSSSSLHFCLEFSHVIC